MEVTRLILVLQILGSTWSNAEHRFSENGFDPAAWIAQYTSSPYRPRSIQDNIYFNTTSSSTTAGPEQMLHIIGEQLGTEPTANTLNEKAIVSALLRYGQHHKYVLKTILRGLKLLRDSSILDIRQCVREALFKADHATEATVLEHEEEKHIVKALLTEPNYMEFCVQKTAHKNMRKQVYDSLMAEVSSVIKNRQVKQLVASPDAVSSTIRTDELDQPTTLTPADPVENTTASLTTLTTTILTTTSPTIASSNGELQESSTTPNTEGPFEETEPPQTSLNSTEVTLAREDINTALNKEVLTSEFSHQINKPYQSYISPVPNKIRSKIPLIYHLGTISAPGFNYAPHPYLSIFTVGEIDPQVMAEKAIPIYYPGLHRTQVAKEEIPSTTTEELPLTPAINIQDNEASTEVTEVAPQTESIRTVKKMLSDDDFEWPGPFAMERQRVIRSPTEFSLDMEDQGDDGDMTDEGVLLPENSRAPKEYLLPLMIPEPVPVISVPGEIPDLGKEFKVVKEFSEPASTVEPPIVLKVQRVPTHVDTSEFWNTRKDEHVQESSSVYPSQVSEEANIWAFLDGLRTTESSLMRESKMLKEEAVTDSLVDHSQQSITVTGTFLETTTATTEYNKIPTAEVPFSEEAGESSNESASNESASSSEEDEATFETTQRASSAHVYETTAQDYDISHTTESITEIASETSAASEETTTTKSATEVTVESLAYSTTETSDDGTESGSTTAVDDNAPAVSTQITAKAESASDSIDDALAETATMNLSVSDTTEKPIVHTVSATTVTLSEGSNTSQGAAWDPDFDFVVEEFSSSHIAKDDIPYEYMDYSLSLLGELAKSVTELTAKSTMLKTGKPSSSQTVNETHLSATAKQAEDGSAADSKDSQPTSGATKHLTDQENENMEVLLTSFQDDAVQKELSGLQHSDISSRSKRQVKHQELPSAVLKLLKDKSLNTETMLYHHESSASGNQIPVSQQKFPKSKTQKILLSLSDKRRKSLEDDAENETDSDFSVDENASIMELIDINRVSHVLDKKHKKA